MADEPKKIFVDDDWKAEARREKERLEKATEARRPEVAAAPSFIELLNLLAMQAMAGLGMLASSGGERIPANLDAAKHFIDILQMLEDKTKGNLAPDEKKLLDQTLYELRMYFVQRTGSGGAAPGAVL